ncbi:MAG: tyrosine-type recombinase/integrase [Streptosporangiaceae bacterium]
MATKPKCACLDPSAPRSGFGSLRILPSGRHQARYSGPDGRLHKAPMTFDTHGDAQTWLTTVRADLVRGAWLAPDASTRLSVYAEDWLTGRALKPRTREHYRKLLDRLILPTLGVVSLRRLNPLLVRDWYATLDTTTPTLRAHAYSLLKAVCATAVADDLMTANPCRIRSAGQAKRASSTQAATLAELETLVGAMPAKYQPMTLLAAWCALRFGELTELRVKDVDLRHGVIRVRRAVVRVGADTIITTPKSDAGVRDVAIPPHLMPLIKAHVTALPSKDSLLFPAAGDPTVHLRPATLYRVFYPAREAAGRPDLRWHDLRHTGAVLAAATGATLAELMARLGHSTPGAAMRYQHAAEGRDAQIAKALSALAGGESP